MSDQHRTTFMRRVLLAAYRARGPLYYGAVAVLVASVTLGTLAFQREALQVRVAILLAAFLVMVVCGLLSVLGPRWLDEPAPRVVQSPVEGRWLGMNSPASKVPSHGVRTYGQSYAIDLVHEPADATRPEFGDRMMRPAQDYPAFGQPVFAMVDGTVVAAADWHRDHRARSNRGGLLYLMAEGMIREIGGPGFIVGNHVTIRTDDGVFATVAHLEQGSVAVSVGDRVVAGTQIGSCGNSGNSSEPHVHAQLMDRASLWTAMGLPMTFAGIMLADDLEPADDLPENGQHLTARRGRPGPLPDYPPHASPRAGIAEMSHDE